MNVFRICKRITCITDKILYSFARRIPSVDMAMCVGRFFLFVGYTRLALLFLRKAFMLGQQKLPQFMSYPESPNPEKSLLVSVIIPTYNRADSLARCLDSLVAQTLPSTCFEIIVVNNACTDNTEDICARYASRFDNFIAVNEATPGLLAARHAGWRIASADVLTFCDDDIEAQPEWLETIVSVCRDSPDLALLGGNNYPAFESPPPAWMPELWSEKDGIRWNAYHSHIEGITFFREAPLATLVFGCNYTIRRHILEAVGGFEPDVMGNMLFQGGGETGIIDSIVSHGGKVYLHPGVSVRHHMPDSRLTLEYMYKRGVYFGVAALYSYLRSGCGLPPSTPAPEHVENPALKRSYDGQLWSQKVFAQAVFASPKLRDWIVKPTYLNAEAAPLEALAECRQSLVESFGW